MVFGTEPDRLGDGAIGAVRRARTILAVCHEVCLDPSSAGARSCGLLDVGGVPYLVFQAGPSWPAEGAELDWVATAEELGSLSARIRLGRPRLLVRDRAARQVFGEHLDCLQQPPARLDDVVVVPFVLLSARLAAANGAAPAVEIAPDAVADAEPDWLLVHGSSVAAHLVSAHAGELSELAGRCGWPGSTVGIRRLSTTGLVLDILTADGVTVLDVPFDPPIRRTADLWPRLMAAVALRTRVR